MEDIIKIYEMVVKRFSNFTTTIIAKPKDTKLVDGEYIAIIMARPDIDFIIYLSNRTVLKIRMFLVRKNYVVFTGETNKKFNSEKILHRNIVRNKKYVGAVFNLIKAFIIQNGG